MGAVLALASSLSWGSGDFLGGRATRVHGVLRVLVWSQVLLLLVLWAVVTALVLGGIVDIDARAVLLAAGGGAAGVVGLAAFYQALAIGPMAVVPPIAAAGVVVPVAVGLAAGDAPGSRVLVGLAVAVLGVVLASVGEGPKVAVTPGRTSASPQRTRVQTSTLLLCLVAASGFAIVFVAIDAAAGTTVRSAIVATAGVRAGSCVVLALVVLATRAAVGTGVGRRDVGAFALIGALDTTANLLFAVAAALGRLEVVAVLGSLYPAVTSGLACLVLGERLGRLQLTGIALAMVGVVLLA